MLKKCLFLIITLMFTTQTSFADFQYTEEHTTQMNNSMGGMSGMPNMQGNPNLNNLPPQYQQRIAEMLEKKQKLEANQNKYLRQNMSPEEQQMMDSMSNNSPYRQGEPDMSNMPDMENMPPEYQEMMTHMMPQMQQQPKNIKTVYIKGSKKRIDNHKRNTSTITRCDKQQIIKLDHKSMTYSITNMNNIVKKMQALCHQGPQMNQITQDTFSTEIPKQPYIQQNQGTGHQLIIKTSIKDTGRTEIIGNLRARHYIREYEMYGNPNCAPNMKTTEHIWAANFEPERMNCPVLMRFQGCNDMPHFQMKGMQGQTNCFKNARYIQEGLKKVPGFIVKRVMEMDMSQMMGNNMPQMPSMFGGGNFKTTNTTLITNISRTPLSDQLFEIPASYTRKAEYGNYQNFDTGIDY